MVSCIPSPAKVSTVSVNRNFLIVVRLLVNILEMFSQNLYSRVNEQKKKKNFFFGSKNAHGACSMRDSSYFISQVLDIIMCTYLLVHWYNIFRILFAFVCERITYVSFLVNRWSISLFRVCCLYSVRRST